MRMGWVLALALLLAGCATVRLPGVGTGQGDALLAGVLGELRDVANRLEAGEEADFDRARVALTAARAEAVVGALEAEPKTLGGHAALQLVLGLCAEGLDRVERRSAAEPMAGPELAGAFRLGCVAPLTLLHAG